jgi:hypothetical protein
MMRGGSDDEPMDCEGIPIGYGEEVRSKRQQQATDLVRIYIVRGTIPQLVDGGDSNSKNVQENVPLQTAIFDDDGQSLRGSPCRVS